MMRDFVKQHQNGWATTESFMLVAGEHFTRTPLARKYQMKDLNWFFRQWVFGTELPSYRLEYAVGKQPDQSVVLSGTIFQDGVTEEWFMLMPVTVRFGREGLARIIVYVDGPKSNFRVRLPRQPDQVLLDPDEWVLSEKTTRRGR